MYMENKFIAIIWWFVLMVVIPWDQEKIVVVSLVIFSYLLYYMVGSSIEASFGEKKRVIKDSLTTDIDLRVTTLRKLIEDSRSLTIVFSNQVLLLIQKLNVSVASAILVSQSSTSGVSVLDFSTLNRTLFSIREQYLAQNSAQLLAISKSILEER